MERMLMNNKGNITIGVGDEMRSRDSLTYPCVYAVEEFYDIDRFSFQYEAFEGSLIRNKERVFRLESRDPTLMDEITNLLIMNSRISDTFQCGMTVAWRKTQPLENKHLSGGLEIQ